jgi:hypothetical protein
MAKATIKNYLRKGASNVSVLIIAFITFMVVSQTTRIVLPGLVFDVQDRGILTKEYSSDYDENFSTLHEVDTWKRRSLYDTAPLQKLSTVMPDAFRSLCQFSAASQVARGSVTNTSHLPVNHSDEYTAPLIYNPSSIPLETLWNEDSVCFEGFLKAKPYIARHGFLCVQGRTLPWSISSRCNSSPRILFSYVHVLIMV